MENLYNKNTNILKKIFNIYESQSVKILDRKLIYPSYIYCIKTSHIFNLIESKKTLGHIERINYMKRMQNIIKKMLKNINKI